MEDTTRDTDHQAEEHDGLVPAKKPQMAAAHFYFDKKKSKSHKFTDRVRAYETSFMANLASLYINGGSKVLYSIALNEVFKSTYKLSPNELQSA